METLPSTIKAPIERELVIKRSRFIAQLHPVNSLATADAVIAAIRKQHWSANHNCTALVVGPLADQQRSSDDGEPAGTAGIPMLEVLRNRRLTDVVAVVTRYFGGVLLGAGGLVRAYSGAVAEAVACAEIVHRRRLTRATVETAHADAGRLDYLLRDWALSVGVVIDTPTYGATVRLTLWVPDDAIASLTAMLAAATGGVVVPEIGEHRIVNVTA